MTYIAATLNHFKSIKSWAERVGADVNLDVNSFELEIKARHRYYRLQPQFLANVNGRHAHVHSLTPNSMGLSGWLPYKLPLQWPEGRDKLLFKSILLNSGHRSPAHWLPPSQPELDYILKRSCGSFGYEIEGPYPAEHPAKRLDARQSDQSMLFMEQFVRGDILKLWFWGETPFFAHLHGYPRIQGDGATPVDALINAKIAAAGLAIDVREMSVVGSCLAYQKIDPQQVLAPDISIWLDYRYGRRFDNSRVTATSDNRWRDLSEPVKAEAKRVGQTVAAHLLKAFRGPVLYAVDGVVDTDGNVWWLEMNSNPILPPDGYELILGTLFGSAAIR